MVKDRLCIPNSMRAEILSAAHDSHHMEYAKSIDRIKENHWWKGMAKDTKVFCQSCLECQWRRDFRGFENQSRVQKIEVSRKFEMICAPRPKTKGYEYVLVITDYATKWTVLVPIKDKEAKTIADAIWEEWICIYGCPERISSDVKIYALRL